MFLLASVVCHLAFQFMNSFNKTEAVIVPSKLLFLRTSLCLIINDCQYIKRYSWFSICRWTSMKWWCSNPTNAWSGAVSKMVSGSSTKLRHTKCSSMPRSTAYRFVCLFVCLFVVYLSPSAVPCKDHFSHLNKTKPLTFYKWRKQDCKTLRKHNG